LITLSSLAVRRVVKKMFHRVAVVAAVQAVLEQQKGYQFQVL